MRALFFALAIGNWVRVRDWSVRSQRSDPRPRGSGARTPAGPRRRAAADGRAARRPAAAPVPPGG